MSSVEALLKRAQGAAVSTDVYESRAHRERDLKRQRVKRAAKNPFAGLPVVAPALLSPVIKSTPTGDRVSVEGLPTGMVINVHVPVTIREGSVELLVEEMLKD